MSKKTKKHNVLKWVAGTVGLLLALVGWDSFRSAKTLRPNEIAPKLLQENPYSNNLSESATLTQYLKATCRQEMLYNFKVLLKHQTSDGRPTQTMEQELSFVRRLVAFDEEKLVIQYDLVADGGGQNLRGKTPSVMAVYGKNGQLLEILGPPHAEQVILMPYYGFIQSLQYSLNQDAHYQELESDPFGVARVNYRAETPLKLIKEKVGITGANPNHQISVESGHATFELNKDRTVRSVSLDETIKVSLTNAIWFRTTAKIQIAQIKLTAPPSSIDSTCLLASVPKFLAQINLVARQAQSNVPEATSKLPEKFPSLSQLEATLKEVGEKGDPKFLTEDEQKARNLAIIHLAQRLRMQADEIERVFQEIVNLGSSSEYVRMLMGALGSADTPLSQVAVLNLMKHFESNPKMLLEAMALHHNLENTHAENVDFMISMYKKYPNHPGIHMQSLLASSAAAKALKDPLRQKQHAQFLLDLFDHASKPTQRDLVLAAMENQGSEAFVPTFVNMINGADELHRIQGISALGKVQGVEVDQMLDQLIMEPAHSTDVRIHAARALRGRTLSKESYDRLVDSYLDNRGQFKSNQLRKILLAELVLPQRSLFPGYRRLISNLQKRDDLTKSERDLLLQL